MCAEHRGLSLGFAASPALARGSYCLARCARVLVNCISGISVNSCTSIVLLVEGVRASRARKAPRHGPARQAWPPFRVRGASRPHSLQIFNIHHGNALSSSSLERSPPRSVPRLWSASPASSDDSLHHRAIFLLKLHHIPVSTRGDRLLRDAEARQRGGPVRLAGQSPQLPSSTPGHRGRKQPVPLHTKSHVTASTVSLAS